MTKAEDAARVSKTEVEANRLIQEQQVSEMQYGDEVDGRPFADVVREERSDIASKLVQLGVSNQLRDSSAQQRQQTILQKQADNFAFSGEDIINKRRIDNVKTSFYEGLDSSVITLRNSSNKDDLTAQTDALLSRMDAFKEVLSPAEERAARLQIQAESDATFLRITIGDYKELVLAGEDKEAQDLVNSIRSDKNMDAELKEDVINSIADYDKALRVERNSSEIRQQRLVKEAKANLYDNLTDQLLANDGDLTKLSPEDIINLDPGQQRSLFGDAERIAKGIEPVTDYDVLDSVEFMDVKELGSMTTNDFYTRYRNSLNNEDWKRVSGKQRAARDVVVNGFDPSGTLNFSERITTAIHDTLKIDYLKMSNKEKLRVATLRRTLSNQSEQLQQQLGRKLTWQEEEQMIADNLLQFKINDNWARDPTKPIAEMTRQDMKNAYVDIDDIPSEWQGQYASLLRELMPELLDLSDDRLISDFSELFENAFGAQQASRNLSSEQRRKMQEEIIANYGGFGG